MPGTITIDARNDVRVLVPSVERLKSLTGEQHLEVLPEKSIRASNRPYVDPHSGILHCMCGHEMGQLQWPLAAGIHHLNGRCRWSCCNASWEEKSCSHEMGNVVNDRSKYKPWEKTRTYDSALESDQFGIRHSESELVGTLRKSKASDKANELLSSWGNLEELKEKEVGEPSADAEEFNVSLYADPTPTMESLGEVIVEGAAAAGDGALYGAGVVASLFHSNLIKPFLPDPVMIPAELEEILQAIIECDDSLSENHEKCLELLAAATKMYLAILELSDAQFLTIEGWIEASSAAWKSYHKAASAPLVMTIADEVSLKQLLEVANVSADEQLLAELLKCCFEDSRSSKLALKATRFLDWYVMNHFRQIKFTIPEVTGFPLLLEINLSAAALALKKKPSLYSQHKDLITQSNFTFDRAVQCGLDYPLLSVGCVAGDEESYTMFRDFYIAAIVESGVIAPRGDNADVAWDRGHRGCKDWSFDDVTNLNRIDASYVRHCAVKARRNLSGISFPTHCSRAGRRKVERIVHAALTEIEGEFAGSYQPLFKDTIPGADTPSEFCRQIGAGRDWPWGRGVYKSDDQSLCIFVNGEDHLNLEVFGRSLLGRTENCDIVYMFQKLSRSVATIEHCLFQDSETSFATSPEFGFLTSDPAKCGTALDMEYGIKLDNLTSPVYGIHAICARLGLSCSPVQDGLSSTVWSISVVHRIGCSEVEMMQILVDGVVAIITIEKALERKDADGFAHLVDMLPRRFSLGAIVRGKTSDDDDDHEHDEHESATFPRIAVNPEDDYPLFNPEVHTSLMSKHLTRELYSTLRSPEATKSACGWSVSQLIRVGVEVPSHPTGILMGGVESYETYKHLLAPILIEYHGFNPTGYDRSAHITDLDLVQALNDIEAIASVYLRKISISTSRNLSAFPFPPSMSRKQRRMVEFLLFNAFKSLDGELVGNYVPLRSMNKAQHKIVAKRGAVFVVPSYGGPLVEGGCARDMPDARGVFMSKNGRIMGLINGENHVNVVVEGGSRDVADIVKLFAKTMDRIEAAIQPNGFCFAHSDRLGYLTTRVEEVGTAMRMRFSVVLPALSKDPDQLISLAAREDLTVTQDEDNNESWTFANIKTLCISETETLKKMLASLLYISRLESSFRKQAFTPALNESLSSMRRKSLTSHTLVEAIKQRNEQVAAQKAKAAEDMSRFITSHKGRSASRSSFVSVIGSLQSRAEEEERQRREARNKIASVLGSQRKVAKVRMSFHSLMDDLKASVPMTPSEKFFLESSESPNKRDSLVGGDMFISLAPDTPLVDRKSADSPGVEQSERKTPPLSPPKPPRASTPTITTAEQEMNNLIEEYKEAIGLADKGRSGVFTTIRTVALPHHMDSSITKGNVAMVSVTANTTKDKPNTTKFEVFIDPISYTLHWGMNRGSQHKCLTLAECSEIAVNNKSSFMISRSEVLVSFKTESETVKIQLPVDSIMSKQKKIKWVTDLQNLLAMRSKTISFTPAAQKFLGL